jgi:hypothetical protein
MMVNTQGVFAGSAGCSEPNRMAAYLAAVALYQCRAGALPFSVGGAASPHISGGEDRRSAMKQPGLDQRHRDKSGEISRKHGNTLVRTLRKSHGADFASGFKETDRLFDVLQTLDEPSLSKLVRDHQAGTLEGKIKQHS